MGCYELIENSYHLLRMVITCYEWLSLVANGDEVVMGGDKLAANGEWRMACCE